MAITALPTSPARTDTDEVFSARADAFVAALPLLVSEINATVVAFNLNSTNSTSVTSTLIGTGSKTITVEASKSYVPGQTVKIAYTTDPTKWMLGDVISYNVATGVLVVSVLYIQGAGTFAAWTISLAAPAPVTIPSGSQVLFFNSTAPTGWTQNTAADDYAIRLANSGGGTLSASAALSFTAAFASKAVIGANSAVSLTKAQIPQHTHTYSIGAYVGAPTRVASSADAQTSIGTTEDGYASGLRGDAHNHTFTGTPINLAVRYVNMILCVKT